MRRIIAVENALHLWLVGHSAMALRISVGAIFLGFGVLKYLPGVSPAEDLVVTTMSLLTFGLVPDWAGLVFVATVECLIGLCLLTGRGMRLGIWLLAVLLVGILSPLVLLTDRLFTGLAPTLEGQYVIKDVIVVSAGLVIAATSFRGGRIVRDDPLPPRVAHADGPRSLGPEERLGIVLAVERDDRTVADVCREHDIPVVVYQQWRDQVLEGATRALAEECSAVLTR
ncbi:MAG: transposase [Solirubrobacteraceae bacterium MAG38_C4-C5]|nr:transposase [Candidatus Siliceabacter maunaloa]